MSDLMNEKPHHRISDAIENGDLSLLAYLLEQFPEYAGNEMLNGWLHYASREGQLKIVDFLLRNGFDVNKQESGEGINPLRSACSGGHLDVVRFLLDHGATWDLSKSVRNPLFAVITESIKDTMNKSWGPPTGEAPEIARLLLERGLDAKVRYNTKTMKNMDAVAFAMMMGALELAHVIALWNADGNEAKARELMAEGLEIARANTKPIPPGEQIAPS